MSIPLWGARTTAPGLGSGGAFSDPWSSRTARPPTTPPGGYGSGGDTSASVLPPGSISLNPLDPIGSAGSAAQETGNIFTGLKDVLFGTSKPDAAGQHGGLIGDIPLVGAGLRAASEAVGNVGEAALALPGEAINAVGGGLEHLDLSNQGEKDLLKAQFDKIPDTSPAKKAALIELQGNGSIVGPAVGHIMSKTVRAYQEEMATTTPSLFGGLLSPPGSAADTVTNMLGFLGMAQRGTERLISGVGKANGMNRLQEIDFLDKNKGKVQPVGALGSTKGILGSGIGPELFTGGSAELSDVERVALDKWRSREWTETQALDFLSSHGSGLSHDVGLEIAGTMATDPLNVGAPLLAASLARLGAVGVRLATTLKTAETALAEARATGGALDIAYAERAVEAARTMGLRAVGSSAKANVLGGIAERQGTADFVRLVTKPYVGMQGAVLGRSAKLVRTIIDPLHALDLRLPGGMANVDLLSDAATKAIVDVHGAPNHLGLLEKLDGVAPTIRDMFSEDLATYSGNVVRNVVGLKHRAAIMIRGLGEALIDTGVNDVVDDVILQQKSGILRSIAEEANRFRVRTWDEPALQNLADRASSLYKTLPQDGWLEFVKNLNDDQRALLHAATYGRATKLLLDGVAKSAGKVGTLSDKLHRLILINRTTLTTLGAQGILDRVASAESTVDAIAEIRAAQRLYPRLRYIAIDATDLRKSVTEFESYIKRRMPSLPMQVTHEEAAGLDESLRLLNEDLKGEFTLGFKPQDEYLWGIERTNAAQGLYDAIGDVWVDHVANGALKYRAGRSLNMNIMGQPIIGPIAKAIARPIDYIEAMGRVLTHQVTGTMIAEAAHGKFMSLVTSRFASAGMADEDAQKLWKGLQDLTSANDTVVNPRGFSAGGLWKGVEELIPGSVKRAGLDQRALLGLVLDAYDGDVRFLGLTQKLTSRMKAVIGKGTGVNFLGEIAEHAWPLMKFRLNLVFQAQEKIEPWVLNAQRGISFAVGTKLSASDIKTEALLQRMVEHSLVRMGDVDQGEYAARIMLGKDIMSQAAVDGSALGRIRAVGDSLLDVRGVKRINMLRTFRDGLGKQLKAVWEKSNPGEWDQMLQDAQLRAGHLLSEDDFAVQMIADKMLGNDILIQRLEGVGGKFGGLKAEFQNAIRPGRWAAPQSLGELQSLDLDGMAKVLDLPVGLGAHAGTQAELRAALASGKVSMEDIARGLRDYGADPDYVRRVENALRFSWTGFWDQAKVAFNLTAEESTSLQDMIAGSARLRGLTPIDYMSQVFSPNIALGMDGAVGDLGKAVELIRGGQPVTESNLARITRMVSGKETLKGVVTREAGTPTSTRADLVRQLSAVFSAHLDPSAKRALLMEFRPELRQAVLDGKVRLDLADLTKMWDDQAEGELADRIIQSMSADPIVGSWDRPLNASEYLAKRPSIGKVDIFNPDTDKKVASVDGALGPGFMAQPQDLQAALVGELDRLQTVIPEVKLTHFDIRPLSELDPTVSPGSAAGETFRTSGDGSAIYIDSADFGSNWKANWAKSEAADRATSANATFTDYEFGGRIQRRSNPGVSFSADPSMLGTVRHEYGHAVYRFIARKQTGGSDRFSALRKFFNRFEESPAARQMSEYGMARGESAPELLSLALNPEADLSRFTSVPVKINLDELPLASDMKDIPLRDRPGYQGVAGAPKTTKEAVEEVRQLLLDSKLMKTVEESPDVVRATRMFSKWSTAAVQEGMFGAHPSTVIQDILANIAKMPTDGAVPYNHTEALVMTAASQAMEEKWRDAYRLQYFAQSRSMLERSINHPMFGIYPASYMWGKLMPEIVRFIAKSPFGIRTGAMAWTMLDVQKAIAIQREFDPEFNALIEKMGHSQMLSLLGYMLPTLPWDIQSSFPNWARDLSAQGLANQAVSERGGFVKPIDLIKPLSDTARKLSPYETSIPWIGRAIGEAMPPARPIAVPATTPEITGPVPATELGPTLEQQMQELRSVLRGG